MNKVLAISLLAALAATSVGCSRSYDTTQVDASGGTVNEAAPTTAMIVETIPPSTVPRVEPLVAAGGLEETLTQLVSGFAQDPELVAAVQALNDGDLASIAALFDIDLGALNSLGLSTGDIGALGQTVLADLAQQGGGGLVALLGGLGGAADAEAGSLDPMTLIGLLAQSLNVEIDVTRIAQSAIPQLIGALFAGLQGAQLIVTPEIVVQLDDMLERIDPHAFDDFIVTADNAPFIALLTSVVLGNNPLLQQGITDNPDLNPELRQLLKQLEQLNAELGETTSSSIYEALLNGLFQDLSN